MDQNAAEPQQLCRIERMGDELVAHATSAEMTDFLWLHRDLLVSQLQATEMVIQFTDVGPHADDKALVLRWRPGPEAFRPEESLQSSPG